MSYSGYGNWNSGTNRGYEDYSYGYGYSQDNSGNYGYDTYESYDSRPSLNDRDLYRSGYDYSEAEHDTDNAYEGHYDNSYGNRRDQYHNRARDNFGHRGQNWPRDGRNNRSMAAPYSGRMGGQWNDPPAPMGGRGHGPNRPPSLFSHKLFPEYNMFQGMRGFSGNMRFGGGGMKQRMRRNWKMWDADFKKKRIKTEPASNKRKQANSSDEPDSKAAKTDGSDNSDSDNEEGPEGEAAEKGSKAEGEGEGGEDEERKGDSEKGALTIQEEISQIKRKLQAGKKTQERQKKRYRDRMVESRIQFVCSLCKYRTFYEDEMTNHLESKFHKEHFKFVGTKLPQQTADFLQEYVANKTKKTEERRKAIEDINAVIQQIYKDQDLTQDIGMEHFVKKVEAAHCAACDLFIPMQYGIIQKHLKSPDHNHNRRAMMEQSKKSSLVVARSILNNKLISKKLERYLKGENPFTDDPEEKEEHEEGEAGTSGNIEEGVPEGEGSKDDEETKGGDNLDEENPVEESGTENKGEEEEGEGEGKEPGQGEDWNLNTSQESFAAEQEQESEEERKGIIPSEELEPPDE
ncbi:A-kinase anchor protein 8-like isoform X3 [Eublepharis macularius]|uniref:A-kinase anchor protein 8-like isoform X3 n=1 Tax=Eublepharis macularius TaxID=481883 RepID=A0AA97J9U3_EUBMA|nr:A-kinase anchor protein 8-like isoform X3 [Eublepharis macularius]XP_054833637.1 A-kinase anchor protein 8-like isoform X3 [Eublepharis macularius]